MLDNFELVAIYQIIVELSKLKDSTKEFYFIIHKDITGVFSLFTPDAPFRFDYIHVPRSIL